MRRLLAPLTVAALAFAGCGDDSSDTASTASDAPAAEATPSTPSTSTPSAAADTEAKPVEIGMKGLQFMPKDATVKVGSKVTWVNNEDIPHNVVAEKGAEFQSDTFGKDKTYDYEAKTAGVVKYVCTIHPGMEGTLTVEE